MPESEASVTTRVVSWIDAAAMNESVESNAFVILERAGWMVADAGTFLDLPADERRFIDTKLALAAGLRQRRAVRQLAEHFHTSPAHLTEEQLRQYFLYLANEKHVARTTATIALCAIRFLYEQTLHQPWPTLRFVRPAPSTRFVTDDARSRRRPPSSLQG